MDNKNLKLVIITILILLMSSCIFFSNIKPVSNTLRDNNLKMTSKSVFDYLGAESFTDDLVGNSNPGGWVITTEDYSDYVSIVDSYTTHSQVMRINDYSTSTWDYTQGYLDLGAPQVEGSFSFWLNIDDDSRHYTTPFILAKQQKDTYSGGYEIIIIRTCAYNDYQNIMEIRYGDGAGGMASDYFAYDTDTWYRIQIDFRSLNSPVYEDAEVKVLIYAENRTVLYNSGWVAKGKDVDYVEVFSFCTRGEGESHDVYIDALDWSWAPGYYEGRNWDYDIEARDYKGAESFFDDGIGNSNPDNWIITKEDYSDYISVVGSYTTHSQVMRINDYSTSTWDYTQGYLDLGAPQVEGSFSFWLNIDDESRHYTTPFILAKQQKDTYSGGYEIVIIRTCAYNDYQNIMEIKYGDGAGGIASDYFAYDTDTWYRIQIDFRSLNSPVYEDAEVKVLIYSEDHILLYNSGWVAKGKDVDYVKVFSFCTRGEGESHDVYIDALDWSWAPGYYIGRNWDYITGTETENIGLYQFIQTIIVVIGISIFIIYYNYYRNYDNNKKNKINCPY